MGIISTFKQNCGLRTTPTGPILFEAPADFLVDSNDPIFISIDPVVLIQYTESHENLTYQIPSQIHLILPHTTYKPLGLVETIQNILKFKRKSGVLREKRKESFWRLKTLRFPRKAAWPTILQTAITLSQIPNPSKDKFLQKWCQRFLFPNFNSRYSTALPDVQEVRMVCVCLGETDYHQC